MDSPPQRRRAARHQQAAPGDPAAPRRGPSAGRKQPITVDAIVETALGIVEREGYASLTMRRVAGALETGPASLYAHVVNKEDLDDLLVGRLCAEIELPEADPRRWREQLIEVCTRIREQYQRYPGISLAALAVVPTNLETLRVSEGLLAVVLAGGADPQTAAWAIDALLLYINAFCLENSLIDRSAVDRDELPQRFAVLPDSLPNTKRYATELTAGTAQDRFEFTLGLIMDGLGNPGTVTSAMRR
ncbi:TetR/AcrR family transcriptional regulator [Nocardia sp. alder85J]|uniref:TetR/AcrR family transcriptional regulator n=1 Tax=Nocardia sp. alder85J TaxID=2862949 RepID=UPI001CD2755D|nr:TetR/AcrR family transcriptional regulator [Nocardia sp. alder85J]MCX4096375.1 TetR/AcrR family transcriptional regulator [Nocardia sp. alder85J]